MIEIKTNRTRTDVPRSRSRRYLYVVAVIGLALVVAPAVFNMFQRAPKGATMLSQFKPFMTTARLDGFQNEMAQINAAVAQTDGAVATRFSALGQEKPGSGTEVSGYTSLQTQWPQIDSTMTSMLDKVQANIGNYRAVAALPSFDLFPWFFVIPGVLLFLLALAALTRPAWWSGARWAVAALGVGLILAPLVFQMFTRSADGGRMMSAFRTIETNAEVGKIQTFFATMADGQGALRLQIVPALETTGLSPAQVARDFPAVVTLDANWVHILNDMTPMIGAMSDNVTSYQAIASLPPFPLFPWFFVAPGVLVLWLGVMASPPPAARWTDTEVAAVRSDPALRTQGAR